MSPEFFWSGNVVAWNYFNLDHLGSVAVITDQGGNVLQRLSFDAWGKQRNANGTSASCGTITSTTTKGFTNQEQMPTQCLVNLNARLYDSSIGKFMAADSIVPDPYNAQSYNRYAYVANNPLSFTDPTGHFYNSASQTPTFMEGAAFGYRNDVTNNFYMKITSGSDGTITSVVITNPNTFYSYNPSGTPSGASGGKFGYREWGDVGFGQDGMEQARVNAQPYFTNTDNSSGFNTAAFWNNNGSQPQFIQAAANDNGARRDAYGPLPTSDACPPPRCTIFFVPLLAEQALVDTITGIVSGGAQLYSWLKGKPAVGLNGRQLSAAERAAFEAFGKRAQSAGLKPNPNRTGSWGTFDANGKFREVTRIDVGEAGRPGFGGQTHMHNNGQGPHLPLSAKIPGEP